MAKKIEFKKFLIIECTAREMYVACGSPGICDFAASRLPVAIISPYLTIGIVPSVSRNGNKGLGIIPKTLRWNDVIIHIMLPGSVWKVSKR